MGGPQLNLKLDTRTTDHFNHYKMRVGGDVGTQLNLNYNLVDPRTTDNFNLHSKGKFFCQRNQSVRYIHSCLEFINPILTSTNNPSRMSVILESCAKPGLPVQQKIQEPLSRLLARNPM